MNPFVWCLFNCMIFTATVFSYQFSAYTPYEYTEEGMLQRMSAYIQHQQFCDFQHQVARWPPSSAVTFLLAQPGLSCSQACWAKGVS